MFTIPKILVEYTWGGGIALSSTYYTPEDESVFHCFCVSHFILQNITSWILYCVQRPLSLLSFLVQFPRSFVQMQGTGWLAVATLLPICWQPQLPCFPPLTTRTQHLNMLAQTIKVKHRLCDKGAFTRTGTHIVVKNIARIANAVQVTICLLASTSVY